MLSIEELSGVVLGGVLFVALLAHLMGSVLRKIAKLESRVAELEKRA